MAFVHLFIHFTNVQEASTKGQDSAGVIGVPVPSSQGFLRETDCRILPTVSGTQYTLRGSRYAAAVIGVFFFYY